MKAALSAPIALLAASSAALGATLADKITAARNAGTAVGRIAALEDSDFVFDFLHPPDGESDGAGGHTVAASAANMPGIIGNGMAMTIGFLGPCGLNTPHTHPRATEFNFAVNGTLIAGMLQENGARFVFNEVAPGSAVVFPKGAIHYEMNNGCEDMIFVAAFDNEDPGVLQVAQRFFGIQPAIVAAAFGSVGVEEVAGLEALIPNNIAFGVDECLNRCGLTRTTQPTTQRQPRLGTNALPAGFSGPPPPAPVSTSTASGSSSSTVSSSSSVTASTNAATATTHSSRSLQYPSASGGSGKYISGSDKSAAISGGSSSSSSLQPVTIALIVVVGLMAIGYVAIAAMWFVRRRNTTAKGFNPLKDSNIPRSVREEKPLDPSMEYNLHEAQYDPPLQYTDSSPRPSGH